MKEQAPPYKGEGTIKKSHSKEQVLGKFFVSKLYWKFIASKSAFKNSDEHSPCQVI